MRNISTADQTPSQDRMTRTHRGCSIGVQRVGALRLDPRRGGRAAGE